MLLSVVVIGRNEGERLIKCLQSVFQIPIEKDQIEFIYVDSNSSDGSVEKAEALGVQTIVVNPQIPSASCGRNAGWRAAKGEYVLFLDGDTIVDPQFVMDAFKEFEDPQIAIVSGHRREIDPDASIYQKVMDLNWVYPKGFSLYCGGDAIMRRKVLDEVGGYDPTLWAGEEPEMCRRIRHLGYKILYLDRLFTLHDFSMYHFSQYWQRAVRSGYAYAEVSERFKNTDEPLWLAESRFNVIKILALAGLCLVALGVIWITGNLWIPIAGFFALISLLILRTALRAKEKCRDWMTRLAFAFHSHFQHIPVFVGQMQYWLRRRNHG